MREAGFAGDGGLYKLPPLAAGKAGGAMNRDTIYARASGQGSAGVAIIRISGPNADAALAALSRAKLPAARQAAIRTLYGKENKGVLDKALVLRFPAPHSYTGEDIVEIQGHGGPAVVSALLVQLGKLPGLRLAEPGEFTRRAVEAGRMDLVQAEALADLVAAETEAQRWQALRQFGGGPSAIYEEWRSRLIRAGAWLEAVIDFPDEEIPPEAISDSRRALAVLAADISKYLDDGRRGEIVREGFRVAIIGPPNAGKSSLLNALARRDVAIVSATPGTTRDIIEVHLDLQGMPVILADTAGLRTSSDEIEQEGVRRSKALADLADMRLLVLDGAASEPLQGVPRSLKESAEITVWNKADLANHADRMGISISARTGDGLPQLIAAIAERAGSVPNGEGALVTRARHREALAAAVENLQAALAVPAQAQELAAEHVRRATRDIGRITGRVDLDELLDVVFRDFCIGK